MLPRQPQNANYKTGIGKFLIIPIANLSTPHTDKPWRFLLGQRTIAVLEKIARELNAPSP